MRHGSLFSGIGGFDLAAEWMGWQNVFHCEINDYCNKILKQHFPDAESYTDITTTDFSGWKGRCDIVTGGFPCQPYSQAGKRKGKEDDRHLWPQMLRAIREIQPAWVVGENVPGLLNWQRGVVLSEIVTDLETEGFEVFPPLILPACSKNAFHKRERLWIVAYNQSVHMEKQKVVLETWSVPESRKSSERFPNSIWRFNRETYLTEMAGDIHGISNWVDRSKALGNSIVPQVAYEIFKVIEQLKYQS
jgi:DNA-cytosine methyltransferase